MEASAKGNCDSAHPRVRGMNHRRYVNYRACSTGMYVYIHTSTRMCIPVQGERKKGGSSLQSPRVSLSIDGISSLFFVVVFGHCLTCLFYMGKG